MDAQGDLPQGDILITGDKLTEIAPRIHVDDAEVIDGSGYIVIPGLVNAHMHTWQTALRGLASNWTLLEYFRKMHAGLATVFEPQDLYIATLVGALNQLNSGPPRWQIGVITTRHRSPMTQRLPACWPRAFGLHFFMARPSLILCLGRRLFGKCHIHVLRLSACSRRIRAVRY